MKHLITTWDEDWVGYLGDAFYDFTPNLKIPPLATAEELVRLTMPCLVMGAEHDISFSGARVIERVQAHIPGVQTELISDSLHSPPTTPEFRKLLGEHIGTFLFTPHENQLPFLQIVWHYLRIHNVQDFSDIQGWYGYSRICVLLCWLHDINKIHARTGRPGFIRSSSKPPR